MDTPAPGRDELVQVAFSHDLAEAGMIQGLLEEQEIPSLLKAIRPSGVALVKPLLPESPQRVMVRAEHADQARRLLDGVLVADDSEPGPSRRYGLIGGYARALAFSLLAMAVAFGVFVLLRAL